MAEKQRQIKLSNSRIVVTLTPDGKLVEVENPAAGECYRFRDDGFAVVTDQGELSSRTLAVEHIENAENRIDYYFKDQGGIKIELNYTLDSGNGFFQRTLKLRNAIPLRLLDVRLGRSEFAEPARETVHYLTFWQAPTVEFVRYDRGGWFTGIENPFYRSELDENGVALSFPPGLILKAGEGYESEPQFLGVYARSGVMIEDSGRPFRFPNASGHIPIDRNESRAMRLYALDYLRPEQKDFLNINYQFFHPLPQMPKNDREADYYFKTIDTFAAVGGNMMIFNPMHPYTRPDAERPFWNLLPDDPNAPASRIVRYATEKGIGCGFYMGCAAHGNEGNAAGLPFRTDKPEWKKTDADGRRAPDNCLGCDEFYEWWFMVQDNTIKKYHLTNWSWDPSRGSAMNCHDESHGHIAGMGAYKGWRRCMELGRRLKADNPGLFIQAFYGTKQFGLWGLAAVDGHEVYNEQTAPVCTHHTQISDDRQNADGLRFQNYWSMRFRFLPTVIGHPLVGRMSEGYFNPDLIKACDYYGWQYGLMSALAISGTIMPAILPYETRLLPGYMEFYRKWTAWAKQYFDYVPYTEPFGGQVQPGTIDGYARIRGAHGFIFLFNGNPRPAEITFEIGDEINLHKASDYELAELYPATDGRIVADRQGRSIFLLGETATLCLPANSCQVLELRRATLADTPILLNCAGVVTQQKDSLALSGIRGKPGTAVTVRVRHPNSAAITRVTVNGHETLFQPTPEGLAVKIRFAGELHTRELDDWRTADGRLLALPNSMPQEQLRLKTQFRLAADIPQLLRQAMPPNAAEMDAQIAAWQQSEEFAYSYHNFTGCRPQRLWLAIPFLTTPAAAPTITINGKDHNGELRPDRNGNGYYLDLTDLVRYGDDNEIELELASVARHGFMGPFLIYPEETDTAELTETVAASSDETPVVYTEDLTESLKPRYRRDARRPQILKAAVTGKVTLSQATRLEVTVDRPLEQLQAVKFTESGFGWMGIGELKYDPEQKVWMASIPPGPRERIQENEYIYVWAIGSDGLYSDYASVRVEWDFLP